MKKFKSLISLLLVVGMLLTMSAVPTYAASRITVHGGKVASVTPPGAGNWTNYGTLLIFGKGQTFNYTVTVPRAGKYHISVEAQLKDAVLNTIVGGNTVVTTEETGLRKETYIGKFDLKAGDNTVSFKNTGSNTAWLYNIYADRAIERVETDFTRTEGAYKNYYIPTIIEAEDYDLGASGSHATMEPVDTNYRGIANLPVSTTNGATVVTLRAKEWANYTFNASHTGSYKVSLKASAAGKLELYFDNQEYPIPVTTVANKDSFVGNVYLKEGTHTLKVVCPGTLLTLDSISFAAATESGAAPEDLASAPLTAEEEEALKNDARPVWKEIWVSADAKANGNGSKESPFKTILEAKEEVAKLRDTMKGDIVVKILPGEYTLEEKILFTTKDGGKNGYKVIYQGANALERPIISGGTHVKGWQPYENGVWKATVEGVNEIRQLYVNGFPAQRARSKYVYNFGSEYNDPETDYTVDGYGVSKLNVPLISHPEDAELVYNQLWTAQRVPINRIVDGGDQWYYVFDQPHFDLMRRNYNANLRPLAGGKSYIENAYELIDEPGEFFYDKHTNELFYYPFPQENLKTADTVIGRTEFMMDIHGDSPDARIEDLTFDNIDFRYSTWADSSRTGVASFQADCIINENADPNNVQGNGLTQPAAIDVKNARKLKFTNCNFQNLGSGAIAMTEHVDDSEVIGNVFKDMSGTAVIVGSWRYGSKTHTPSDLCENIDIRNNVIRRTGGEYYNSVAIGVYYANGIDVSHNDIEDVPYTAISLGWGWGSSTSVNLDCSNHTITNNHIVDISKTVRDGGHIYMLSQMNNTIVEGNHCVDSVDYGGVYFDTGSSMITVTRNVFEECTYDNIAFGRGDTNRGNKAYNNWADREQGHTFAWTGAGSSFEAPHVIADGNWPEEARQVIANAGVQRGYKRLLTGHDYPAWRTLFMEDSPNTFYASRNIIETHAFDYMPGGEGVGYHENKTGKKPQEYRIGLNHSIGDTSLGEWLAYEIDIAQDANYFFELSYALNFSGTEENAADRSGISLYIDDVKVIDDQKLESTGSWNAFIPHVIGEAIPITKGKHVFKIVFENGWAFEKFRLIRDDFTETEPEFDDGTMLSRKGTEK